jgi:hypothetical protein
MSIEIIHEGACETKDCENEGLLFDAPSIDGVVQPIICGVCGVDFSSTCTLKE